MLGSGGTAPPACWRTAPASCYSHQLGHQPPRSSPAQPRRRGAGRVDQAVDRALGRRPRGRGLPRSPPRRRAGRGSANRRRSARRRASPRARRRDPDRLAHQCGTRADKCSISLAKPILLRWSFRSPGSRCPRSPYQERMASRSTRGRSTNSTAASSSSITSSSSGCTTTATPARLRDSPRAWRWPPRDAPSRRRDHLRRVQPPRALAVPAPSRSRLNRLKKSLSNQPAQARALRNSGARAR